MGISQRLRDVPRIDPEAPALNFRGTWRPWRYYTEMSSKIDAALTSIGVGKGAPVGLLPRNTPAAAAAAVAILGSERCIVCISPLNGDSKVAADIESLALAVIIGDEQDWLRPELAAAAVKSGTVTMSLLGDARENVSLSSDVVHNEVPDRSGEALEMLTSGTTGPPKRVVWSYERLDRTIDAAAQHYHKNSSSEPRRLAKTPDIVWTPMVHMSGMWTVVQCVAEGRKVVLLEKFDPTSWASAVETFGPKAVGLSPTAMKMVLEANIPKAALSSLKAVRSGSAALPVEVQQRFEDTYGVPVLTVYGATEFAGAASSWTLADHLKYGEAKRGSSGRALPGVELRVVNSATFDPSPEGSVGLLEVKMPSTDWMRTSDLAQIDAEGFLWIRGRVDDAISRGGFKIDPRKVESVLKDHPGVRDAAVVGLPDERLGSTPVALVVLAAGDDSTVDESSIIAWARAHLAPYEVPTRVDFSSEIPLTVSGKVARQGIIDLMVRSLT